MDFSCGFQVSLSSGRRSRNFLVIGAWISNSARSDFAIDILILLFVLATSEKADPSAAGRPFALLGMTG
jgi:hypothetical protein